MKQISISLIKFYQKAISPHLNNGIAQCKYYPSCSVYMIQSIEKNGLKGFFKGLWRILRCNPFSKGGYDPVK